MPHIWIRVKKPTAAASAAADEGGGAKSPLERIDEALTAVRGSRRLTFEGRRYVYALAKVPAGARDSVRARLKATDADVSEEADEKP